MPGAISYPIGPAIKWAYRLIPPLYALGESLLDEAETIDPATEWRHLQVIQNRATPAGTVEDKAMMTFDLLNITGLSVDPTWTTTDFTTAEARFTTYLTALKPYHTSTTVYTQYRWYKRKFNDPLLVEKRFADTGPPERITTISIGGTSVSPVLPYQVACSTTEKTPWPRHWGRWYIPSLAMTLTSEGRFPSGIMTVFSNAAGALLNGLRDDELPLVVPSSQTDQVLAAHLLGVTAIQVDDVPDIQRRRRAKQPAVRQVVLAS